ncbi:MAG: RDD family protein [Bacillota bacterium]
MYSGFFRRLLAFIIDLLILYLSALPFAFLISKILEYLGYSEAGLLVDKTVPLMLIVGYVWLPLIIGTWIYFATFEKSKFQSTIGKMVMRIKVVDLNGNRISLGKSTVRYCFKMILFILNLTCVFYGFKNIQERGLGLVVCVLATVFIISFFGFIMMAFNNRRQTIYDIILGTLVIKKATVGVERRY